MRAPDQLNISSMGALMAGMPPEQAHFYGILKEVYTYGAVTRPRGQETRELTDYQYVLPPRVRFMSFDHRKLKLDYIKQEVVWYLRGDRRDVSIRHLAKMWDGLINLDGTINSNYGYYIFAEHVPTLGALSNFDRVVETLKDDPDSRRAVICILDNDRLWTNTKDYPCTCYLNFHIRDNRLHLYVRMRSQDAIFGMGNDAPFFSIVHELMWSALRDKYPTLELGAYHHTSDSLHVYAKHYEMVEKIISDPVVTHDFHVDCPEMKVDPGKNLVAELRGVAQALGTIGGSPPDKIHPFTAWLLTRDDPATIIPAERAS